MTDGHIFISYARQDGRDHAARLDESLQQAGFATWRDTRDIDPNQDFSAELEGAISASSHVVCCVTPDTTRDNSFVRREIGYALAVKKPIVPLVFDDTIPPIQIINVTHIKAATAAWEQTVSELSARLRRADDRTYEQVTLPADPYRDYLTALYDQIVRYLNLTVFSLITLRGESSPDAVERTTTNVLPMAFFDMAGVDANADEQIRFNNFQEAFAKYDGRVLLLGEPGAGKTTTLFAFARDAVAARLENPDLPLPILAPIATWDAEAQTPLSDWLAASIPALKPDDISRLIASGNALLLLDGLDELGGERPVDPQQPNGEKYDPRLRFMSQLTPISGSSLIPHPSSLGTSLIVSCRIKDYNDIGAKLSLTGAVTLQPLNDDQMRDYLRDVPDLWAALESDDDLREVARTPLLLSLFTFAFRDLPEEAKALRSLQRGDLRDKIFETYVKKRYDHEKRKLHVDLPLRLEEIYRVLGQLSIDSLVFNNPIIRVQGGTVVFLTINGKPILSSPEAYLLKLNFTHFFKLVVQLNLLIIDKEQSLSISYRFLHPLLRDHFAFRLLLIHLASEDKDTRESALYGLGNLGDPRAVDYLVASLADPDRDIRDRAVYALEELGDPRAVEPLIAALTDPDQFVRSSAVSALGKLGDAQAVEPIIAALADPDNTVRYWATEALGKLGDVRAVDALIAALADPDKTVRYNTAFALGKLSDTRAVEPLISALADPDKTVRSSAITALGKLGDARAVDALISALADPDKTVRSSAITALGKLGDARAVDALIAALADPDKTVRYNTAIALGSLGDPRAVNSLFFTLDDPVIDVSYGAARALIQIGTPEALAAVEEWRKGQGGSE